MLRLRTSTSFAGRIRSQPSKIYQIRQYAEEASSVPSDKLRLSFSLPHQALYKDKDVSQVNLSSTAGDMGILANHVPTLEQLKPGVVEIVEDANTTKKYFVSGGFAIIHPGSVLSINAIEGSPLEDFSLESVRSNLQEAQRIASGSGSEEDVAEAKIEVEILEALQAALK